MKRLLLVLFCVLSFALPSAAQDPSWQVNFFDDYDDNEFGWPLGTETQGTSVIERRIQDSSYIWSITSSDPNVSWMALNISAPTDLNRHRFAAEVDLPDFDPLACAGIMLGNQGSSFYGFVVCNDKTYSLIRSTGGNVENLIPYTPIKDYDSFAPALLTAEVNDGWVDLYYNDQSLDTYDIGFTDGRFGLIAMPQSTKTTEIAFGVLAFQSTDEEQETTFQASAVDPNASDSISRLIKMLNMKERIVSTAGTYMPLPDRELSLAMMGYSSREPLNLAGTNLLISADIAWASGYERPDYQASGCGFTIREYASNSYIEVFASMDGAVYVSAYRYGIYVPLITLKYGSWSIEGSGRLGVAADGNKITILWNDSILGTITDATWIADGAVGYLVHSGTNGDFGTKCIFSNAESYIFE